MQIEELQGMTVVELRKLAREHGVKLSAGIDKENIVKRLVGALNETETVQQQSLLSAETSAPSKPEKVPENDLQDAPLSADVTAVAPRFSAASAYPPVEAKPAAAQPQAWHSRISTPVTPRPSAGRPAWGPSQRPASPTSRFGPQVNLVQSPETISEDVPQPAQAAKQEMPPLKLDGYKLGYRAAPQRQSPQRGDSFKPSYRADQSFPRQNYQTPGGYTPQARSSQDVFFNDGLYKPMRDFAFSASHIPGEALPDLLVAGEGDPAAGVLEILPDGYGFLRSRDLSRGKDDVYVSIGEISRFHLRSGDWVEGPLRKPEAGDKFLALLYVEKVNGREAEEGLERPSFERLTPVYPRQRIVLEGEQNHEDMSIRMVDLVAPIGFGQRAMIIAPPESGRLAMLSAVGRAIKQNDPNAYVMVLLLNAAPEDITELQESLEVEIFASTFADAPDNQIRVSELMIERAQRLVEEGQNVVILMDSLTKLTRAYQSALTQSGRAMTNTVTPAALVRPKRFFSMARNTREAGSLTMIATITVVTGSRIDDIIFEEFKGTANMELRLCAPSHGDPLFPLIDLQRSATKKEDILLKDDEKESLQAVRTMLGATTNKEAVLHLMEMMKKTKCNADLFNRLKDWVALWEKSGLLNKKG